MRNDIRWKRIYGFDRYEVSTAGEVRSYCKEHDGRILKQVTHWKGYKTIYLHNEGGRTKFFIHRLVALAFIHNPEKHPIVNHKDLDKANNNMENLEWIDDSGNQNHWRGMRVEKSEYDHVEF